MPVNRTPLSGHSPERTGSVASDLAKLVQYLQYSEYELILYMASIGQWSGSVPLPPAGFTDGAGSIDYGVYLYWMNHPDLFYSIAGLEVSASFTTFMLLLETELSTSQQPWTPPDTLLGNNYSTLTGGQLIYKDGSVLSTIAYALYDPNWLYALFNLSTTIAYEGYAPFSTMPATTTPALAANGQLSIGLLSDWGSGESTAVSVMNALTKLQPNYLMHLGDIYYSGTPSSSIDGAYGNPNEIQDNFLTQWPQSAYAGKSFTLNGNHEMYSGANGYFLQALAKPTAPAPFTFSAQQGCSYGAIQVADWTILYLDSAYYSSSFGLFMYGTLGGAGSAQAAWIQSLKLDPKKVIVMTHHNGFDPTCDPAPQEEYCQPFWDEVNAALGGDPYAWYWGHVHNAIVYNTPLYVAGKFSTHTKCRCIGNGCLPYGAAKALGHLPQPFGSPFEWCAQYDSDNAELYNGYAVLTFSFSAAKQVSEITEDYYLVNGTLSWKAFGKKLFRAKP